MPVKRKPFEISIFSLDDILELITFNKTGWNIVSIRDSDRGPIFYQDFVDFRKNYKDIIIETFDDILNESDVLELATSEQVKHIIEWSKDKARIAVHCSAGVSRSSAIAYLIACTRMPEEKALGILSFNLHSPNRHIVRLGANLLGRDSVYGKCMEWLKAQAKQI